MSQSDYNVANADGATVRADINSQLDAIGSQNSGAAAPLVAFPYMRWFDTTNQQLKERNGANTGWRIVAEVVDGELVPYSAGESVETRFVRTGGDLAWQAKAIGERFGVSEHLTGVAIPPATHFIKLTANLDGAGQYNEGKLINETITGSGALLVATAEIADPDSPMNGQTVHLWNTEGRYPKPGEASGEIANDQMQRITGYIGRLRTLEGGSATGAFSDSPVSVTQTGAASGAQPDGYMFDSANSPDARTGTHTDVKHEKQPFYMKIKEF